MALLTGNLILTACSKYAIKDDLNLAADNYFGRVVTARVSRKNYGKNQ